MTEGEPTRLVAWAREMRMVHDRLRRSLEAARGPLGEDGWRGTPLTDLLLYCRGFCAALTDHHQGEDRWLFPAISERYPELRESLRLLEQDHETLAQLVTALAHAVDHAPSRTELDRHLDGIAALMESHFGYEERKLLRVLETLDLDLDPADALGAG